MLDPLTLDQLRVLVAVAETGSFSAAARRLGRVQSAISQAVQALETALGTPLFDRAAKVPVLNETGQVILSDARQLLMGVGVLRARAESVAHDLEPELTLAVDAIFPSEVLVMSLGELAKEFPCMPVTLYTEALGGAEQRLRDGVAKLGIFVPIPGVASTLESEFLMNIPAVPVVAADHPLAAEPGPLSTTVIEQHVQLVLTDRTPVSAGFQAGIISRRTWRFADPHARLEFLLAGFGWCNMPIPAVRDHIAAGRLKVLDIGVKGPGHSFPLHVVHQRGWKPGRASRWLIEDVKKRMSTCVGHGVLDMPSTPVGATLPSVMFDFAD